MNGSELTLRAPVVQTVIGAVIGAFGAIAGGAFGSWFTWQKERQSLAAAFAGEVQGLIDVISWREFRQGILAGQRFPMDEHPFPVFDANVGKIGLLPAHIAGDVAGFYSYAKGIVQDIKVIYKGEFPGLVSEADFRQKLVKAVDKVEEKGNALIAKLEIEARSTWVGSNGDRSNIEGVISGVPRLGSRRLSSLKEPS